MQWVLVAIVSVLYFVLASAASSDRRVNVIVDFNILETTYDGASGAQSPSHASVHIEGSETESAVHIQIMYDGGAQKMYLDMFDYKQYPRDPLAGTSRDVVRKFWNVGTTTISNVDLLDPNNDGRGILRDIWTDPNGIFKATWIEGVSDCIVFAQSLYRDKRLGTNIAASDEFDALCKAYTSSKGLGATVKPEDGDLRYRTSHSLSPKDNRQIVYPIRPDDLSAVQSPEAETSSDESSLFTDDRAGNGARMKLPDGDADPLIGQPPQGREPPVAQNPDKVAVARVGKVNSVMSLTSQRLLKAAGIAGDALAAAFIILDIVEGDWKGAAIGAIGLALGVVASLTVESGPVGWLLGGAIALIFAILPMTYQSKVTQPKANNIQQIIQYQMFGDALHTGNEKCQKTNPACQAVYGPGVIALVFKWDLFDAVSFLLNFNQGFPMTVPDMAKVFTPDTMPNAVASVHCDVAKSGGNAFWVPSSTNIQSYCLNPRFSIDRNLIHLPNVNQTATQVFSRIIPKPNGDCKLLNSVSNGEMFASQNLSVLGLPVAIACNITAATNVNGIAIALGSPASPPISSNATLFTDIQSPGTAATNGNPGAYTAPPPATNFQIPFNETNSICMCGPSAPKLCLPNGTYVAQTGRFGHSTVNITTLSVPKEASLSVKIDYPPRALSGYGTILPLTVYGPNTSIAIDARSPSAWYQANHATAPITASFNVNLPPTLISSQPPAACFFSAPDFGDQVFCLGVGGGNFSSDQANTARSVKVFGGAQVFLFAMTGFADASETRITADVSDLKSEPYGSNDNMSGKIKAAWITGSPGRVAVSR